MAAFGLTEADFEAEHKPIEIWPDNWDAVLHFCALATQWRAGMAGPTGLDYSAIEPMFRLRRVPREQWPDLFEAIRVMEDAALERMREASEVD